MKKFFLSFVALFLFFPQLTQALMSPEELQEKVWSDPNYYERLADWETFEYLPFGYAKDKNFVYHLFKIPGADPKTFEVLTSGYAKDRKNLYYDWYKLEKADVHHFIIEDSYLISKNVVYYFERELPEADPQTFRATEDYAIDKNFVYLEGQKVEGIDTQTFKAIDTSMCLYGIDKHNVFTFCRKENAAYREINPYEITKLDYMDPATFEYLGSYYIKDKNGVYYKNKKLEGSDPVTFLTMFGDYSKDKNNVYYKDQKIEGADAKTFYVLVDYCGKTGTVGTWGQEICEDFSIDKNYTYKQGQRYKPLSEFFQEHPGAKAEAEDKLNRVFYDVPSTSPLHALAAKAKEQGWISGYPEGTLYPTSYVNRAEFAKMVILAFGKELLPIPPGTTNIFPDTPAHEWYSSTLYTALKSGIMTGYPDGTAKPANTINKVEALRVVLEMLGEDYTQTEPQYQDTAKNQWYSKYTAFSLSQNPPLLPADSSGILHPAQELTRGEAIELISKVLVLREANLNTSADKSVTLQTGKALRKDPLSFIILNIP